MFIGISAENSLSGIKGRLFPAVCLRAGDNMKIQANFSGPFRYKNEVDSVKGMEESDPV